MNGFEIPQKSVFCPKRKPERTGVSKYKQNFPQIKLPNSHVKPHERLNQDIERMINGTQKRT